MMPTISFLKWYEDETIDTVFIEFSGVRGGYCGYFDLPDDIRTEIFYCNQSDDGDETKDCNYIEVVNPEPFLNSDFAETFEVNGYNVKKLILDAYQQAKTA